jgi:hypothetical protein
MSITEGIRDAVRACVEAEKVVAANDAQQEAAGKLLIASCTESSEFELDGYIVYVFITEEESKCPDRGRGHVWTNKNTVRQANRICLDES